MRNGEFTPDGREFVITDPRTPRPWHNYLVNGVYLANITQFGTGASFYQPRGEGLRTNVTEDADGDGGPRLVYLRDNESGQFWSLTGAGTWEIPADWRCRIGLGYQVNESTRDGIHATWRTFTVPTDDPVEIWTLTVENRSDRARSISLTPYLEMHLTGGSTLMDFVSVLGGQYDPDARAVFGINSCVKFPPMFKAFLASDGQVAGATVSRDEFLGHYRSYANPRAIEAGDVHNPRAGTEWLGASLRHDLDLPPGRQATIHCAVGVCDSVESGRTLIGDYLADGRPEDLFGQIRAANDQLVSRHAVQTGDGQFDRWMNVWLKHQLGFVARWGRVIGRGFRDILQDSFGHRLAEPGAARDCILEVFSKQYASGKCIRAWRLPTAELDLQDYADSPSWMIMALDMYLKETGDFGILGVEVPFLNAEDPYAAPTESADVWQHVVLAQRHLLSDLGRHGLSKIHYGDWCDTMNGVGAGGQGESVMLSMQVKWGCDLLAELAERLDQADLAAEMRQGAENLAAAIDRDAWDGRWYIRAFDDEGVPVGSTDQPEDEGRIFLNPQSWAVIAGLAGPEQTASAFAAAQEHLDTGYGMVLHGPAFTGLVPRIGQMTAMTPGFYENGSVYVHGNCFWIHALAMAGRGEQAWQALRAILPETPNKPNTDTEPYVIPNYYIGPVVQRRQQRNLYLSGWRTGSAAWLYVTAMEWILGVRAEYDGLRIDPHLPDGWTSAAVRRSFRGDLYEVRIDRPDGAARTVAAVTVDGQAVDGTLIPPAGDGQVHAVQVRME